MALSSFTRHCVRGVAALLLLSSCKTPGTASATKDATPIVKIPGALTLNDLSILFPYYTDANAAQLGLPATAAAFYPTAIKSSDTPNPAAFAPGAPAAALDGEAFLPDWAKTALANEIYADQDQRNKDPADPNDLVMGCGAGSTEITGAQVGSGHANGCDALKTLFSKPYIAASLRLDPCFNVLETGGDDSQCIPQLRILWQYDVVSTVTMKPFSGLTDTAIHGIYRLTQAEFAEAIKTLVDLNQQAGFDYSHEPLEVQPVIVKQGPTGSYYKGILGLIHRYARASKLMLLAGGSQVRSSGNTNWVMATVQVNGSNQIVNQQPRGYIALPGTQPRFSQHFAFSGVGNQGPSSPQGANPSALPLVNMPDNNATRDANNMRHAGYILDPRRNDVQSLECGSCHRVDTTISGITSATIDPAASYTSSKWNLKQVYLKNSTFGYDVVKMFSFVGGKPLIKARVINETAFVTDWVNAKYLSSADSAAALAAVAIPPAVTLAADPAVPVPPMSRRYASMKLGSDGTYQAALAVLNPRLQQYAQLGTWSNPDASHITFTETSSGVSETYQTAPAATLVQYAGHTYSTDYQHDESDSGTIAFQTLTIAADGSATGVEGSNDQDPTSATSIMIFKFQQGGSNNGGSPQVIPVVEFTFSDASVVDMPITPVSATSFILADPAADSAGPVTYKATN